MTAHAHDEARWSYQVLRRYRALSLALVGLLAVGFGVLGGIHIATSVPNAQVDQQARTLATLSTAVTGLAAHLQDERDQTMEYIGLGSAGRQGTLAGAKARSPALQNLSLVLKLQTLTDPWVRKLLADSSAIGAGYPAPVKQNLADVVGMLKLLDQRRSAATTASLPAVGVMSSYTSLINRVLALDENIALGTGDLALNNDVRSLNLVSLVGEQTSEQRGYLAYAFAQDGKFDPAVLAGVQTAQEQQNANLAEFGRLATPQQVAVYQNDVQGGLVDFASSYEQEAITIGQANGTLNTLASTADAWYGAESTGTLGGIRAVEQDLVTATSARASALHRSAIVGATVIGAALAIVLVLALLLTALVWRRGLGERRAPSLRTTAFG